MMLASGACYSTSNHLYGDGSGGGSGGGLIIYANGNLNINGSLSVGGNTGGKQIEKECWSFDGMDAKKHMYELAFDEFMNPEQAALKYKKPLISILRLMHLQQLSLESSLEALGVTNEN